MNKLTEQARFLIAALLVYVAKGDGDISGLESDKMITLLSSKLNIRNAEALELLSSAIMTLSNDLDIVARLQQLGQDLSAAERNDVFRMLLEVVGVDENHAPGEVAAVSLAGQILGLSLDVIHAELRSSFLAQKKS